MTAKLENIGKTEEKEETRIEKLTRINKEKGFKKSPSGRMVPDLQLFSIEEKYADELNDVKMDWEELKTVVYKTGVKAGENPIYEEGKNWAMKEYLNCNPVINEDDDWEIKGPIYKLTKAFFRALRAGEIEALKKAEKTGVTVKNKD